MSDGAADQTECPSCGTPRASAYCAACGQKFAPWNPTLGDFLHDLSHELLHLDGKIFRSVRLLVTRPGFLTRELFAGRRSPYVSPIRLYLTFSIVFFVALHFVPDAIHVNLTYTASPGETLPPADEVAERTRAALTAINDVTYRWVPRIMFAFVPLFAALVMLAERRSGHNYPQHLYFALHVHAAWFLAGTLSVAIAATRISYLATAVSAAAWIYGLWYFASAFHAVYEVGWLRAVWRAALVLVPYVLIVWATLLALWLPTVFSAA